MRTRQLEIARVLLEKQAIFAQTISYRDFARVLGITEPPVIHQCANLLEQLMVEDAEQNRPILSSLVVQRGKAGIPRLGFFQMLCQLNIIQGDDINHWHKMELIKLKTYYFREPHEK